MRVITIAEPEIGIDVRYRLLTASEIANIISDSENVSDDVYMRLVLEHVIYNLKSEITPELRKLSRQKARGVLDVLFSGSIMLNPFLNVERWHDIARKAQPQPKAAQTEKPSTVIGISRTKVLALEDYLKSRVIGQDEAVTEVVRTLKRSCVGLGDDNRPLGVFLFAGASGVGKTWLAKALQQHLFGNENIIRVDCGEYQHKHENAKLLGSPPGYVNADEGGQFTNALMKQPNTVILLDEVEKAHPDLWNTFLRAFDEGKITDALGKEASLANAIVIMTTNLGNKQIAADLTSRSVGFGSDSTNSISRDRIVRMAKEAIDKHFLPEFLNRIDKTIVFNHLTPADYVAIAELELQMLDAKLVKRGYSLVYDAEVVDQIIADGVTPVTGARGLSRLRREKIENVLAELIIHGRYTRGTIFQLTYRDKDYVVSAKRPHRAKKTASPVAN